MDFGSSSEIYCFWKMPSTKTLPNTWYNTPNLQCVLLRSFYFCDEKNIKIKKVVGVNE